MLLVPNTDVSRDVVDEQTQVSGSSRTNFQDNSYLGVGPSSQHQRGSDISLVRQNKGKQPQHHPIPVAPSKRIAPPASDNVRAARPYLKPAPRSSARNEWISNIASSSTGPGCSNLDGVNISAPTGSLPAVESERVGYPTTSILREPSPDSPTYMRLVKSQVPQYLDTQSYHPVVPSMGTPPPSNNTVRAARPYPDPASQALARTGGTRNIASSSTAPRRSNLDGVNISAPSLPTLESEWVRYPTTSILREPSPDSPTYMRLVKSQVPQYLDTQSYHPVAPSMRTPSPANTVRAARPYPNPASQALARTGGTRNIASSSTGPRHSNLDGVNINTPSLPTVEEETGCAYEFSSNLPTHPPQLVLRRVPVPLLPWRTSMALTPQLGTVEFWTRDKATGKITLGTYFADRFDPDPNRLLVNPDERPFPRRDKKGYNISFLVNFAPFESNAGSELTLGIG